MRILYFSNIPITSESISCKKGGGWIVSLLSEMGKMDHQLAVGYFGLIENVDKYGDITIYNLCANTGGDLFGRIVKLLQLFSSRCLQYERQTWEKYESKMLDVIDDFKPDIIHVFGSEAQYGLIAGKTNIPVVLHIQGLLIPCYNSILPPGLSWDNYIKYSGIKKRFLNFISRRLWTQKVYREHEILSRVQYYIGRTDWDKRIVKIFNPNALYFYGGEIMRDTFYQEKRRVLSKKLIIVSTISNPSYKGFDVMLKTAYVLKNYLHEDFEWKAYGNINPCVMEHLTGIQHEDVNIKLMGNVAAEQLKDSLLSATLYVHPSYIDNSPNSVCEAQLLGVTCIACNVGGVPSLIKDGETGYLVPTNDPYQMALLIKDIYDDVEKNITIGNAARKEACIRHDKEKIIKELLSVYNSLIKV